MSTYLRHSWQWASSKERRGLIAVLGGALLVRLLVAPYHGFVIDLQDYVTWGLLVDHHFLHIYSLSSGAPVYALPNYPPLAMYLYGLMTGLYFGAAQLVGIHASSQVANEPLLSAWIKLPAILADLGAVWLLYRLARSVLPERTVLLAAASYAFSPAIVFDGAFWGETDALSLLPLLLALLFAARRRGIWAGILFGVAIMLKPQPVIFAPLLLLYLWRWAGRRQAISALGALCLVSLVCCAPYLLPPRPELLALYQNTSIWARVGHASDGAFNLWWLLDAGHSATAAYLGSLSPTSIGYALFLAIELLALIGVWRDGSEQRLFLGAALVALAFFVVAPLQHERYLYPALALFLIAGFSQKRSRWFYVVASITAFCNMVIVLVINSPDFAVHPGFWQNVVLQHLAVVTFTTIGLALVNIVLLLAVITAYLRSGRGPANPSIAAASPLALSSAVTTPDPPY
ncbi:MAG TPA: glycosyltransferase family 39 protein [Ktedonobacterales bacterium]|nr:glycosyltransferase family 39 protein [Ktedonobacterales bacterium]